MRHLERKKVFFEDTEYFKWSLIVELVNWFPYCIILLKKKIGAALRQLMAEQSLLIPALRDHLLQVYAPIWVINEIEDRLEKKNELKLSNPWRKPITSPAISQRRKSSLARMPIQYNFYDRLRAPNHEITTESKMNMRDPSSLSLR